MPNQSLFTSLCLSAFLVLSARALGQNCDSVLTAVITDTNRIYVTADTELSRRELNKELEKVQAELLNELREAMAAKVLLEVKTKTTSGVFESGETLVKAYSSETEIVAAANITEGEPHYCIDEKNRIVYGIYSLNRKETAFKTLKDCENRALRLVAEMKSETESSDIVDPAKYRQRFEKIKQDARVVVYLDPMADFSFLNNQFKEFVDAFNAFKQTSNKQEFNERITEIEDKIIAQDYSTGLRQMRQLMREYPNRNELEALLAANERRYKMYNEEKVRNAEATKNYIDALNAMNEYCGVVNCTAGDYDRITDLREAYFDDELSKFERAIDAGQMSDAATGISRLKMLASANPKAYQKALTQYNTYLVKTEMSEVEIDLYRMNYKAAYAKVKQIENEHGSNYSQLQSLKQTTAQRLLRSEVKLEKQTRRKLFSLGLGVGVLSNPIESVEAIDEEIRSLTFAYSAGIYKKFNYRDSRSKFQTGRSDVIGLRFRLLDYNTITNISSEPLNQADSTYRYDSELSLDGTIFRGIHYSAGVFFRDRQWDNKPVYTGELGMSIPIQPFSIQVNARAVFYDSDPVYTLTGGVFLNLDFWRQFGKKDRRAIQMKYNL